MNPLQKIKSKKSKPLRDEDLPYIHDLFMKEYGWISVKDFRDMPLSTFWNLLAVISERNKKEPPPIKKNKGRL